MTCCLLFYLCPPQTDMESISLLHMNLNMYQRRTYHNMIFASLFDTSQVRRVRKMTTESLHISQVHILHICRQIHYYMNPQNKGSIGFLYRLEVRICQLDSHGNNHQPK